MIKINILHSLIHVNIDILRILISIFSRIVILISIFSKFPCFCDEMPTCFHPSVYFLACVTLVDLLKWQWLNFAHVWHSSDLLGRRSRITLLCHALCSFIHFDTCLLSCFGGIMFSAIICVSWLSLVCWFMSRNRVHLVSAPLSPDICPQSSVLRSSGIKTRWGRDAGPLYNQDTRPLPAHSLLFVTAIICGVTCNLCPLCMVSHLVSHWPVSILNNMHGVSPLVSTPTTAVPAFHLTPAPPHPFPPHPPPHYGLTGRIIKNLKMPKKIRQGAQNSGKISRKLELIKFSASDWK